MNHNEKIGKIIKESRIAKGYTQAQLASKCGLSVRQVVDIEHGKVNPKIDTVINLCRECDIDIGILSDK